MLRRRVRQTCSVGLTVLAVCFSQCSAQPEPPPSEATPNRLIHEKSPYLLQHAHNPVDWYPWGEEAFERARREDKPVFLSIGYSTCHWCHVMERESFSNQDIAATLNRHFVSIKVDREERPDIDQLYMTFVQASTGQGGWPLNVFLTPQGKPFFGGTYFPPEPKPGLAAFPDVLAKVIEEWDQSRDRILNSAEEITNYLKSRQQNPSQAAPVEEELLGRGLRALQATFDSSNGGFGTAPKFPRASTFLFLLRYAWAFSSKPALEMVTKTLQEMAKGGIRDHVGGGFHRYSTDARWFLPHFEKMLYDQAQLSRSYLEAHRLTGRKEFSMVADRIFEYVLRDLQHSEGGFYSAEDADSLPASTSDADGKREGAFYVWSASELQSLLGSEYAGFARQFGVQPEGNVEADPFGEFEGRNVLHLTDSEGTAADYAAWLQKLHLARQERPRPLRDDKILTSWNGLMISALARGYQTLRRAEYLESAQRGAAFILDNLYDPANHQLLRHYRHGPSQVSGFLDDYAFLTEGLLDLYEADLDSRWLLAAFDLTDKMVELFWDSERGILFSNTGSDSTILIRLKEDFDGAVPAPASVAASNLIRLSQLDPDRYESVLERLLQFSVPDLQSSPASQPRMLASFVDHLKKPVQIFIAGEREAKDTAELLDVVFTNLPLHRIIFLADGGPAHQMLKTQLPVLDSLMPRKGKATAYICEDYVCKLPTADPSQVEKLLRTLVAPRLEHLR